MMAGAGGAVRATGLRATAIRFQQTALLISVTDFGRFGDAPGFIEPRKGIGCAEGQRR